MITIIIIVATSADAIIVLLCTSTNIFSVSLDDATDENDDKLESLGPNM